VGLEFKDMSGIIKNTVFIDEYTSKISTDDEMIVLSFMVKNNHACYDLVHWFETGYEYILDADVSPGEISPNNYLVYVEIPRRTAIIGQLEELLYDLETLTEFKLVDWNITYNNNTMKFDDKVLKDTLILSPHEYRMKEEEELNNLRTIADLPVKSSLQDPSQDIKDIQVQAGII